MAWSRLSGINGYSDAPAHAVNIKQFVGKCGESCERWRNVEKRELADATGYEVIRVMVKYVGTKSWDVLFQLYDPKTEHSILYNWFGSACCGDNAEARAYQYYQDSEMD